MQVCMCTAGWDPCEHGTPWGSINVHVGHGRCLEPSLPKEDTNRNRPMSQSLLVVVAAHLHN
eukprot:4423930-Alexandrium_andersonii.AAC.1